jgi:hypothetical protein
MNKIETNISFSLLLQSIKVLDVNNHTEEDLEMVYQILSSIDNKTLIHYYNNNSIFIYDNDLDLFIEIIKIVIKIFEDKEAFERCHVLKTKYDMALNIIKNKEK